MQLPFLREVFEDCDDIKLLPLMVGHVADKQLSTYGTVLSKYMKDPETLFVISTDFCHWGSRFDFTHKF